ncbi:hypothetical protein [Psychrobacter sp. S1-30-MNA-CIBAN-0213]|uniref:hypothetical protein n=1 Tax=unclassified Psychrobacter TaxID=196806 RepID=UPI00332A7EA9
MSFLTVGFFQKNSQYVAVFLPLFLIGCATGTSIKESTNNIPEQVLVSAVMVDESYLKYNPKEWIIMDPPLRSPMVTFRDEETGESVTKAWAQLGNEKILKLLSNTRSEISINKVNAKGEISTPIANSNIGIGDYRVIMDYTPYIIEDALTPDNIKVGDARIGLGLRLTAKITTMEGGINVGSLIALGAAAKANKLQGTLHVDTIGIRLKNNAGMILLNTTIDDTSILKTLETMAVIQSKIGDEGTHLDPQVIWVKPISKNIQPEQVAQQMTQPELTAE